MLTDDQIDYLLQIKKSASPIGENTARVMLNALGWSADNIEKGVAFLNKPPEENLPTKPKIIVSDEVEKVVPPAFTKNINLKQDPFPVGSTYTQITKQKEKVRGNKFNLFGIIIGAIFFIVCVTAFVYIF